MEAWKHECVKYAKYIWKPMCKIYSKSTIKAPKQREWHFDLVSLSLPAEGHLEPSQTYTIKPFCKNS